jgi:hypothetical protein
MFGIFAERIREPEIKDPQNELQKGLQGWIDSGAENFSALSRAMQALPEADASCLYLQLENETYPAVEALWRLKEKRFSANRPGDWITIKSFGMIIATLAAKGADVSGLPKTVSPLVLEFQSNSSIHDVSIFKQLLAVGFSPNATARNGQPLIESEAILLNPKRVENLIAYGVSLLPCDGQLEDPLLDDNEKASWKLITETLQQARSWEAAFESAWATYNESGEWPAETMAPPWAGISDHSRYAAHLDRLHDFFDPELWVGHEAAMLNVIDDLPLWQQKELANQRQQAAMSVIQNQARSRPLQSWAARVEEHDGREQEMAR